MGRYSVTGEDPATTATPGDTALNLIATTTTHRMKVYYFAISAGGTMADQLSRWIVQRSTVVGTEGAGVVPVAFDEGDPASIGDGSEGHTVEPTYTSATEFWDADVHVRATPQVQLQPDSHIVLPAVAANGVGMVGFSSNYTGTGHATMYFID